jgi:small GTP-binding protein
MYNHACKIVIIGCSGVGKSSIVSTYISGHNHFNNMHPTIGAAYHVMTIGKIKLQIWDTGGCERFQSLCPMYYRSSSGAICVFDVTNRISFDNVEKWINSFKLYTDVTNAKIVLLANKTDLPKSQWQVSEDEISAKAKSLNCNFILTSAVTKINTELFYEYMKLTYSDTQNDSTNIITQPVVSKCGYECV